MLWQFEFDIFDLGVLMYNKSLCFLRKNMFFEEEEERRTKYWRVSIGEWRSSEDRGNMRQARDCYNTITLFVISKKEKI